MSSHQATDHKICLLHISRVQVKSAHEKNRLIIAMSNLAMRRGKHCATFIISQGGDSLAIKVGIIRLLPGWDEKELDDFNPAISDVSHNASQNFIATHGEMGNE